MILRTLWLKEKFKIWVPGKMTMPTRKILGCIETVDFQHMQLWIHWRFPLDGKGSACFVRKAHIHWGKFIGETGCRLLEMQISGHVVSKAFITDFLLFFFLFYFLSILIIFHIQMMKELERMVIKKKKKRGARKYKYILTWQTANHTNWMCPYLNLHIVPPNKMNVRMMTCNVNNMIVSMCA